MRALSPAIVAILTLSGPFACDRAVPDPPSRGLDAGPADAAEPPPGDAGPDAGAPPGAQVPPYPALRVS
jgi:hypothetical protein